MKRAKELIQFLCVFGGLLLMVTWLVAHVFTLLAIGSVLFVGGLAWMYVIDRKLF